MAQSAIVIAVTGLVTAVNASGQSRTVAAGDRLQAGETIRAAAGARAELALDDGQSLILGEGRELVLGAPGAAIAAPAAVGPATSEPVTPPVVGTDQAGADAQRVIQALERGQALDEEVEAPAAGLGAGGGGQGNAGFVRLLRISEGVTPQEYAYSAELLPRTPGLEGEVIPLAESPEPVTSTLVLTATPQVSEGGTVTYVATLGQPARATLTITLSGGLPAIVIPAGASSGSVIVPVQTDDPYVDGETISARIDSAQGGGFDALYVSDAPAVTVVADTIDPTTVTLSSATDGTPITEGGHIVYTVATNNEVKGSPLEVTLSNGVTLTIPVNSSSASATVPVRADDAYEQTTQTLDTVTIVKAEQSAGTPSNFEAIATAGEVNNTVVNDDDVAKVTLSTADVPETAKEVVFTIVVSTPPEGGAGTANVTITRIDGSTETRTVAIDAAGQGSFEVLFSDDDVYKDGDSIGATVNSVSGNYELVDYSAASATAGIYDIDDTSTVTLNGPETVQQGGVITYTAEVTAKVTVAPLKVTLNNGAVIVIPVGETQASVNVDLADDVLTPQTVQISAVSGGNYELLAWAGTVVTDIDSTPSTASAGIGLTEGVDLHGLAVLGFVTGADAMDPARYAFADPKGSAAPTVSGLATGEALSWTRSEGGRVLTATTSGGDTIVLTLSGQSAGGVTVNASISGNLLHSDSVVNIGNVVVDAADTDGDLTTGTISLTVAEGPTPTTTFTSVVGSTTAPGDIYTGLWAADLGVDETVPTVSDVVVTGAKLDGAAASWSFDYNEATGSGSGVISGAGGLSMPFTFTLDDAGGYQVDLAELTKQITVTADDYASTINPTGPTDVYTINYYDTATGSSSTATVTSLARSAPGSSLSLVGKSATGTETFTATAIGVNINASGTGIGFGNNLMSSYADYDNKTKITTLSTESLIFNPEGRASSVAVNFTGGGANAFGGSKHDVLYLTLTSDTGATQTIMLDSRFGDFLVQGNTLTPITSTSYDGGTLSNYTLSAPAGWGYIAELQATPGFYTADNGAVETSDLKLAFGFTTSATLNVDVPAQIDFNATVTDADNDTASSAFTLQTYVGATGSGTDGSDVITGTSGADSILAGAGADLILASPGADSLSGGAGLDTVSYALASASVNADLGAGTASTLEGSTIVTDTLSGIENVIGSAYSDTLTGDSGANVLQGGAGADNLYGGAGLDTASYSSASSGVEVSLAGQGDGTPDTAGGAGSDTLSGIENLTGSSYADTLSGDSGANVISGGGGDDLITGGFGDDTLSGGTGSDTFDYNAGDSGHDVIRDFTLAHVDHGGDRIDLTDLLNGESYTAQNLSNHLSFSENAAGHAQITIDANGDGLPDDLQVITLENISLSDLQAYAGGESDVAIIQKLLDNGNLRRDSA